MCSLVSESDINRKCIFLLYNVKSKQILPLMQIVAIASWMKNVGDWDSVAMDFVFAVAAADA